MPTEITRRPTYMVLSPRALSYATLALRTLLTHCADDLHLHLITDSADDRARLEDTVATLQPDSRHQCTVYSEDDLAEREADRFATLPYLRGFRHGHPCWRKITDPLLLTEPGAEMILLDPDLYFPNRFHFDLTPATGLLLMWQQPNCLLPAEVVRRALAQEISLARHADIGVAHWRVRPGSDTLLWLDDLIGKLGGTDLPRAMHVEAIVWAAIAMHDGGGSLDPARWVCWRRSQPKRLRRKLGASGKAILRTEPWSTLKCFHAGGEAKWWLPEIVDDAEVSRDLTAAPSDPPLPFLPLTGTRYACEQAAKTMAGSLGYHRVFGAKA